LFNERSLAFLGEWFPETPFDRRYSEKAQRIVGRRQLSLSQL
jgi:hypothetical protein